MIIYSQYAARQRPVEPQSRQRRQRETMPEKMKRLWLAGVSACDIAIECGYASHRSVLYYSNKLGLPKRGPRGKML